MTTTDVENWPGDPEGLLGPMLMDRMLEHAKRFDTEIIYDDHIESAELGSRPFVLNGGNAKYTTDALIIATGSTARYLGLESEEEYKGKGVSACATCDGFFYKDQDVIVVGGGNVAVEEAIYLSNIAKNVTLIHRRDEGSEQKKCFKINFFEKTDNKGNIKILWNHVLDEVLGDEAGVNGIICSDVNDPSNKTELDVQGVFIAIGHDPNTSFFGDNLKLDESNYIILDDSNGRFATQTSIEGVFAAGDVVDPVYEQACDFCGSGCMAALDAEKFLEQS